MEALSEEVSDVEVRSDVSDTQRLACNPLANAVIPSIDVLRTLTGGIRPIDGLSRTQVVIEQPQGI